MWVLLGALTRKRLRGNRAIHRPVFWCFFLLAGLSLFVLRVKEPEIPRPFRIPLFPFTPLLFCATCVYMLQSSVLYVGKGAFVGLALLAAGALLLLLRRRHP